MYSQEYEIQLSIIIPCYNEADVLLSLSEVLSLFLDNVVGENIWQFVFVSNGCTDNTQNVLSKIYDQWPNTSNVFLDKPNYGFALRKGLEKAEGKWALIINVDFWDKNFISWAWGKRQAYDLILGSKLGNPFLDKRPKYRKFLSFVLNFILQAYFGGVVSDTHGQKLLYLPKIRPILKTCVMNRGQFDTEFTLKCQRKGLKLAEAPVPIEESRKQKNLMLKKILQNLIDIYRLNKILKNIPQTDNLFYHRYSIQDLKNIENIK